MLGPSVCVPLSFARTPPLSSCVASVPLSMSHCIAIDVLLTFFLFPAFPSFASASIATFPSSCGEVEVHVDLTVWGLSIVVATVVVVVPIGLLGGIIRVPVPVVTFFVAARVCGDTPTPTPIPTAPFGLFTMSGVSDRTTGLRTPGTGGLAGG